VDVTVEELRSRLRQGKIYAAEKVEQSLANFFRKGNLSMLRELALRTTAEQVGQPGLRVSPHTGIGTGAHSGKGNGLPQHTARHRAPLARGLTHRRPLASTGTPSYVTRPRRRQGHGDRRLSPPRRVAAHGSRSGCAQVVSLADKNVGRRTHPLIASRRASPTVVLRPIRPFALGHFSARARSINPLPF